MASEDTLFVSISPHSIVKGSRKLTEDHLRADRIAALYTGLPETVASPGQLLHEVKAAAPRLGLKPRDAQLLEILCGFTRTQDWSGESRPIVWPKTAVLEHALGLSRTQVKAVVTRLITHGLIAIKDSPNGQRYGWRDGRGRIVEAYGFDLSPLAVRHGEFKRLANEIRDERKARTQLRRRAMIAQNQIIQLSETALRHGFGGVDWEMRQQDARNIVRALKRTEHLDEIAAAVARLERHQIELRERVENCFGACNLATPKSVNTDPKGAEYRPPIYNLNPKRSYENTVVASRGRRMAIREPKGLTATHPLETPVRTESRDPSPAPAEIGSTTKLSVDELLRRAPMLRSHIKAAVPAASDIVHAARALCDELEIPDHLWNAAYRGMGEDAVIALAIVSIKRTSHIRTTPRAYFNGMMSKARAGKLHLGRTLWKLRSGTG